MQAVPHIVPIAGPPIYPDLYEVVDGEVRERKHVGTRQVTVGFRLACLLRDFVEPLQIGQAVSEALFHLRDGSSERRPDVAFVSAQRWPFDLDGPDSNAWNVVPNLAVEVISPSNTYDEIRNKTEEYFAAGVELVWVVSTVRREIQSYDPQRNYQLYTIEDTLKGDPVLPGFELPLRDLFSKRYG